MPDTKTTSKRKWLKWTIRFAAIGTAFAFAGGLIVAFIVMLFLNRGLPSIESLQNYRPQVVSRVFSEHGELVGEFYDQRRIVANEIPELVKAAFIAAEDRNFYSHKGIDFFGLMRAAYVNLLAGGYRQGASTITQQVARSFLLSPEKTITRKLKEMILASQIESSLTKDQILHLYLNHIYLGRGAYGIASAAEIHFGKRLDQVNLAEASILAGLPQAPSRYSPEKNPDRVKRRQLYVLKQMREAGFIDDQLYDEAANSTVYIEPRRDLNKTKAPYFVEHVRQYLMKKYGARMVLQDGLRVYTTIDADMYRYAQNSLRKGLSDLDKRQGYRGPLEKRSADKIDDYFEGRKFQERDTGNVVVNQEFEVSQEETKGKGAILMKAGAQLKVGDFLEGIVVRVEDKEEQVFVEYEPGYLARLTLDDMKWATERARPEDDDQIIQRVSKVSDVLSIGDVVLISVKSLKEKKEEPKEGEVEEEATPDVVNEEAKQVIEASLEQHTEVQGAILSVDSRSGYVRSMVGGYDFKRSEFNRAIQAKRQPGSAFKPVVYATALEKGLTPATVIQDSPITFENMADEKKWRPNNYDRRFIGDTTLRNSLLASRNITTIKLLNRVGLDAVMKYARRFGIKSLLNRDFTLALGSSVMTLEEILQPYVVFSNGGYPKKPIYIKKILDRDGNVLEDNTWESIEVSVLEALRTNVSQLKKDVASVELVLKQLEGEPEETVSFLTNTDDPLDSKEETKTTPLQPGQVLSTETSFLMTHLLKENVLYGTGRRVRELKRPASGKTGTTDDNRDAWFIGFTPTMVTGVWVGYDDLRVLGRYETGGRAAAPIWLEYMISAMEPFPKKDFQVPDNIEFARIDPKSGQLATSKTRGGVFEAFVKGTAPTKEQTESRPSQLNLYERDE